MISFLLYYLTSSQCSQKHLTRHNKISKISFYCLNETSQDILFCGYYDFFVTHMLKLKKNRSNQNKLPLRKLISNTVREDGIQYLSVYFNFLYVLFTNTMTRSFAPPLKSFAPPSLRTPEIEKTVHCTETKKFFQVGLFSKRYRFI